MIDQSILSGQEVAAANAAPSLEIVVINLKSAEERRRLITSHFAELSHPWRFFEAHTSLANSKLRYDSELILRTYGDKMTPAQLALCSSHYSVIASFAESSTSDYLLVFEDDVIFDTAFPLDAITTVCRDQGIHYMRLFGMCYTPAEQLSSFYDRAIIRYRSSPAGAQAYILSKEGAARVADTCQEIDSAWDMMLDKFWKTGLPIHSVFPFPTIERWSPTSVPMPNFGKLALRDWLAWWAYRARCKLLKMLANFQLRQFDEALRKSDQGFQQVSEKTFRDG
jgi:glycosyl transferase family 25